MLVVFLALDLLPSSGELIFTFQSFSNAVPKLNVVYIKEKRKFLRLFYKNGIYTYNGCLPVKVT
jgi:hypothetical protein